MPRCAVILALSLAGVASSSLQGERLVQEVDYLNLPLDQDDECAAGAGEEQCALNALQRRAIRRQQNPPNKWCSSGDAPKLWAPDASEPAVQVRVLSYNLFWWSLFAKRNGNGDSAGHLIKDNLDTPIDFMGFQECEDPKRVLAPVGLLDEYEAFLGPHAMCVAYRKSAWTLLARGEADVAEDMPTRWYGRRGTQWMRLQHTGSSKTAFFVNHHGPLSINSGGVCGGQATAHNLLKLMADNGKPGDLLILVGDFNANAASLTIQGLWFNLVHVFNGDSFGGVDNVFSNAGRSNVVSTKILGTGGSDHTAITATVRMGPAPVTTAGVAERRTAAVDMLTGTGAPGDDWAVFWCGRMESDVEFVLDSSEWSQKIAMTDPDRCCKECQKTPQCKAWVFMDQSGGGERCVLHGGQVTSRKDQPGWVSGLPATTAAAAAAAALGSAVNAVA